MSINISDMIFAIINFVIMVFVLKKFLYKPILKVLDERKSIVQSLHNETHKYNKEAKVDRQKAEEILEQAQKEAKQIIEKAMKEAEKEKNAILEETKDTSKAMLLKAKSEIAKDKEKALQELSEEVGQIAVALAERLISRVINKEDSQKLIDQFIEELHGETCIKELKECLAKLDKEYEEVEINTYTVEELSKEQKQKLIDKFTNLLGKKVKIRNVLDQSILGGMIIRFEDFVLDGSLSKGIAQIQQEMCVLKK